MAGIGNTKYCGVMCRQAHAAVKVRPVCWLPEPKAKSLRACTCGNAIEQPFARSCVLCEPHYRAEKRKAERQRRKDYAKHVLRPRRRAKHRGLKSEPLDIRMVLVRDGWRCRACGIDTPRELRGSYEPNAPELDHIIPLARGGEHSAHNLQCLCRSCNQAKGPMTMSEFNDIRGAIDSLAA